MSVNVALPSYLCQRRGHMIESGIRKQPVAADIVSVLKRTSTVTVRVICGCTAVPKRRSTVIPQNIGRPGPLSLNPAQPYGPGSFGENLSLAGILEDEACIGDIWRWGEVRLQICQPRFPCYKLGEVLQNRAVIKAMVENGRTGWYFRVLTPGTAPTSGTIEIESRDPAGVSVAMVHAARLPGADRALVERAASVDALSRVLKYELSDALKAACCNDGHHTRSTGSQAGRRYRAPVQGQPAPSVTRANVVVPRIDFVSSSASAVSNAIVNTVSGARISSRTAKLSAALSLSSPSTSTPPA